MNKLIALVSIVAALTLAACTQPRSDSTAEVAANEAANCPIADDSGSITVAPGLTARVVKSGYGRAAVNGDYADTNVWLWQFDETAEDRHGPFIWESGNDIFQFQLGGGQVIKGWDLGVPCMLEGETRELVVAPDLAYGERGRGSAVPPNTSLIFTIELVKLTSPE
jgi:FKBP-type peptidyl-prolyl cis-trans isomerase FkpA